MNFRYLDEDESKYHRTSFRKNSKYICTNHLDKYLFSIADDIYNYPIICKLIKNNKQYLRLKYTTYYISEQTGSRNVYVPSIGRVYSYQYKAILEIIRSKYEDIIDNELSNGSFFFKYETKKEETPTTTKPIRIIGNYSTMATDSNEYIVTYDTTSTTA